MRRKISLLIFIGYGLLIAYFSLTPDVSAQVGSNDKLAHLLAYGGFTVLAAWLALTRQTFLLLCLAIVAYSGLMEIGQSFVPGREMSALDLLANAAGVLLAMVCCTHLLPEKVSPE